MTYNEISPRTWLQEFLNKRGLTKPTGKVLYKYQIAKEEYDTIPQLLIDNPPDFSQQYFIKYWAAIFCLYVSEFYRRSYDSNWSWNSVLDSVNLNINHNQRAKIVELGLKGYWKRPVRNKGDIGRDLIGSLFLEGGLPWTLVQNHKSGFGRLVKKGIKEFHKTIAGSKDISNVISENAHYLSHAHRDEETIKLLSGIVFSFMQIVEEHSFSENTDIINYLDNKTPEWRSNFPLPIDDVNAKHLIQEWLLDAEQTHKEKISDVKIFEVLHFHIGALKRCEFATKINFPKEYEIEIDTSLLTTMRFEIFIYEGSKAVESIGNAYCLKTSDTVTFKFPKSEVTIPRKNINEPLIIKFMTRGCLQYEIPLDDSSVDTSVPLIFEPISTEEDIKIQLLASNSYQTKENTLLVWYPRGCNIHSDGAKRVAIASGFSFWVEICNDAIIKSNDDVFDIKLGRDSESNKVFLVGNIAQLNTVPKISYIGVPGIEKTMLSIDDASKNDIYLDNIKYNSLSNICGKYNYTLKDSSGITRLRRVIGIFPKDFKISLKSDIRNNCALLSLFNTGDSIIEIGDSEIYIKEITSLDSKSFILEKKDIETNPKIIVKIKASESIKPLTISYDFPTLGARITNENGNSFDSKYIAVDELLGKYVILNSTIDRVETFNLELSLNCRNKKFSPKFYHEYKVSEEPVYISLSSLRDEIIQLLSTVDEQDAYIKLIVETSVNRMLDLNISRYKGKVKFYENYFEILDYNNSSPINNCDPIAILVSDPKMNPEFLDEFTTEGVPTGSYSLSSIKHKDGPWLIIPKDRNAVQFRPAIFVPETNYLLSKNAESLERAATVFDSNDNPDVIDKVVGCMSTDFFHKSWNYVKSLIDNYSHISLNALQTWLSISRNEQAIVTCFYRMDCSLDFCTKMRNEVSVQWESIPITFWIDGYKKYLEWLTINCKLDEEFIQLLAKNKIEKLKSLVYSFQFLPEYITHGDYDSIKSFNLEFIETTLKLWAQDLYIDHQDDRHWPTELNYELTKWGKENLESIELSLVQSFYMTSVILLPMFMARVTVGEAKFQDLNLPIEQIKFYIYKISDFDNKWYSSVYSLLLSVLLKNKKED